MIKTAPLEDNIIEKKKRKWHGCEFTLRVYLLLFFIFTCVVLIVARLYFLQVKAYGYYQDMADNQHLLRQKIMPKRGEIYLKEKEGFFPAAVNRQLPTIYAVPREVEAPEEAAEKLAAILSMDKNEILQKVSKPDDLYEVLKKKLSLEEANRIGQEKLKGIYLSDESWRYYPGGSLASQVIGFVAYNENELQGRYGIERSFEEKLKGSAGILEQERDTGGRWISIGAKSITPAQNGVDIVLSLDHIIQFKAEAILKSALQKHQADSGKIIVMDPTDGKILAMAAEPGFNTNDFSKVENVEIFTNPNVSNAFECGSVFKTFTMAMGLDTGKVTPDTTYVDTGIVEEAGHDIRNSDLKANGVQTMTNVLEKSLNTGVIYVERLLGNQEFFDYVKKFGFGEVTGIDLPNESAGNLLNLHSNRDIEYFTASFGQGIMVTPIQLINAYTAIAGGGELLKPQIIESVKKNGVEERTKREVLRKVISKNTANQLALMLESNVINGHGKLAGVPGYRIGGKTGTAQIIDRETGKYREDATIGSFAGFGPIENPRFVMLVIIDYPKDVEWAESTAAPVFGEMAKFLLDYFGVEPTQEYSAEDLENFNKKHTYLSGEPQPAVGEQAKPQEEEVPVQPEKEDLKKDKPKKKK
jgi:cell division protein FtsI/penicillin-binding protein 2